MNTLVLVNELFDASIEAKKGHNKIVDWEQLKQQIYAECIERPRIAVYSW